MLEPSVAQYEPGAATIQANLMLIAPAKNDRSLICLPLIAPCDWQDDGRGRRTEKTPDTLAM